MLRSFALTLALIVTFSLVVGCGSGSKKAEGPTPRNEIEKNLSQLSAEDQKLAREQKICPVAEEPLGSMGVPEKVMVKGQPVFICCSSCEDSLKKEPEKYLAKLKK